MACYRSRPSMDHIGFMANCVSDLAILLEPLALTGGDDDRKPYTYLEEIKRARPKKLTALPNFPATAGLEMKTTFARAPRDRLAAAGWVWNDVSLRHLSPTQPQKPYTLNGRRGCGISRGADAPAPPDDYPLKVRSLSSRCFSVGRPWPTCEAHETTRSALQRVIIRVPAHPLRVICRSLDAH